MTCHPDPACGKGICLSSRLANNPAISATLISFREVWHEAPAVWRNSNGRTRTVARMPARPECRRDCHLGPDRNRGAAPEAPGDCTPGALELRGYRPCPVRLSSLLLLPRRVVRRID